jgi:hypothetical protein
MAVISARPRSRGAVEPGEAGPQDALQFGLVGHVGLGVPVLLSGGVAGELGEDRSRGSASCIPGTGREMLREPQHRGHRQRIACPDPGDLGQQFRAGPARQRDPGRGGGQLAGQRDYRGPGQLADRPRPPAAGQVSQPGQPAPSEPAPPLAHRVHGDLQVRGDPGIIPPRAAASTIRARSRSRCAVFAPRARSIKVVRSAAVSVTGTARGSGMAAPGTSPLGHPLPGTRS